MIAGTLFDCLIEKLWLVRLCASVYLCVHIYVGTRSLTRVGVCLYMYAHQKAPAPCLDSRERLYGMFSESWRTHGKSQSTPLKATGILCTLVSVSIWSLICQSNYWINHMTDIYTYIYMHAHTHKHTLPNYSIWCLFNSTWLKYLSTANLILKVGGYRRVLPCTVILFSVQVHGGCRLRHCRDVHAAGQHEEQLAPIKEGEGQSLSIANHRTIWQRTMPTMTIRLRPTRPLP